MEREDPTSLAKIIPARYLPDKMRVIPNPVPLVEDFIGDLVGLLHAGDMQIHDIVREALGTELSPRLYGRLIRNMEESVMMYSYFARYLTPLSSALLKLEDASELIEIETFTLVLDQVRRGHY